MKRKYVAKKVTVFVGKEGTVCNRCHHNRKAEPYVKRVYSYVPDEIRTEIVCWKCCHDEQTTELIKQKWPLAFDRVKEGPWWHLRWAAAIQLLMSVSDET